MHLFRLLCSLAIEDQCLFMYQRRLLPFILSFHLMINHFLLFIIIIILWYINSTNQDLIGYNCSYNFYVQITFLRVPNIIRVIAHVSCLSSLWVKFSCIVILCNYVVSFCALAPGSPAQKFYFRICFLVFYSFMVIKMRQIMKQRFAC